MISIISLGQEDLHMYLCLLLEIECVDFLKLSFLVYSQQLIQPPASFRIVPYQLKEECCLIRLQCGLLI